MLTDQITLIFLVGVLVSLSLWTKALLDHRKLPSLIGYVFLGWILRLLDDNWKFLPDTAPDILYFLADIGIITLLFRIGFQSHMKTLLAQLSRASILALSNVIITGIFGYYLSYSILSIHPVGSLFIAIALTATSIGVTVTIWKENKILNSKTGALLLDLIALDDVIGIILLGILIQLAPVIHAGPETLTLSTLAIQSTLTIGQLFLFLLFCFLFSLFIEPKLTQYLKKSEHMPDPIVTIIGFGMMIASLAAFLGFSVALGAFFAGIAFSRDSEAVKMQASFKDLEAFFIPFFFIAIGFKAVVSSYTMVLGMTALLLIPAALGKIVGILLPAFFMKISRYGSLVIAISMIPRAEITMVAMDYGLKLSSSVITPEVYASMVLIALITSVSTPLILQGMLKRRPLQSPE